MSEPWMVLLFLLVPISLFVLALIAIVIFFYLYERHRDRERDEFIKCIRERMAARGRNNPSCQLADEQ